jgi:hypothetical protein
MACDGDIDKREIKLIRKLQLDFNIFGDLDIDRELESLLLAINKDGLRFLKDYFNELNESELSQSEELKLIKVAIATIKADEKVEYSEIKFFKVIRSKLEIDNKVILEKHPDFEEYLEEDIITESYLLRLQDDFFDTHDMPQFEKIDLHLG